MPKVAYCLGSTLLLAVAVTAQQPDQRSTDPRLGQLTEFFQKVGSPLHHLAEDFLMAADIHHLDWRLLPSISFVESGGGKNYSRNNIFGWDCARSGFRSVREGIYQVAGRIAHSKLYRDKDLNALLATYNPRAQWAELVKSVMRRVGPDEPLEARKTVNVVESWISPAILLQSTGRPAPGR